MIDKPCWEDYNSDVILYAAGIYLYLGCVPNMGITIHNITAQSCSSNALWLGT